MMYPYCKYADETEVVFSHIMSNEEGEEIIRIYFERTTENWFNSVRFELPSCKILYKDWQFIFIIDNTENKQAVYTVCLFFLQIIYILLIVILFQKYWHYS